VHQRAGAPVAAAIPDVNVAQRKRVALARLLGGVRKGLGLLEGKYSAGPFFPNRKYGTHEE